MANQHIFKRIEKKYLLSEEQYQALRERIAGMAEVDAYGRTDILNIYYDTPDCLLIRRSLDKPVYKEKLRLRTYGTPDANATSFIELKKKYKGVVYKRRMEAPYARALSQLAPGGHLSDDSQIAREIEYFKSVYPGIGPRMAISYERIAMAGTEDPELRLTFDTNIRYRTNHLDLRYGNEGTDIMQPGQHLLEIKVAGAMPIELAHILSELKIFSTSFSKYGQAFSQAWASQMVMRSPSRNMVLPLGMMAFS